MRLVQIATQGAHAQPMVHSAPIFNPIRAFVVWLAFSRILWNATTGTEANRVVADKQATVLACDGVVLCDCKLYLAHGISICGAV